MIPRILRGTVGILSKPSVGILLYFLTDDVDLYEKTPGTAFIAVVWK